MYSVSMTTSLGLATVLGAIAVVILAHSQDQASIPNQCKAGNCAIGTNIGQIIPKKVLKSTQQSNQSADGQMILTKKDKSLQAIVLRGSADKPARKKPAQRLVKQPPQRLAKTPPQRLVENPAPRLVDKLNYGRSRREDDPSLWRETFN